jgi:hypothetical protein
VPPPPAWMRSDPTYERCAVRCFRNHPASRCMNR